MGFSVFFLPGTVSRKQIISQRRIKAYCGRHHPSAKRGGRHGRNIRQIRVFSRLTFYWGLGEKGKICRYDQKMMHDELTTGLTPKTPATRVSSLVIKLLINQTSVVTLFTKPLCQWDPFLPPASGKRSERGGLSPVLCSGLQSESISSCVPTLLLRQGKPKWR